MPPLESDREPVKEPEEAAEYVEESSDPHEDDWRNLVAFWILGMCNNYGYVVMLSAAHDIISQFHPGPHSEDHGRSVVDGDKRQCNYISTGAILLADIIPSLLTKLVSPFFPLWVNVRMALIVLFASLGFILVGAAETQWVAILGVVTTAFSSGLGEATLLSYMPFFKNKNVVSTWASGTGGAGVIGSLSYAGLIQLGLSPSTTLYVLLIVPAAMSLSFWVLLKRPSVEASVVAHPGTSNNTIPNGLMNNTAVPLTFNNDSFFERFKSIPPLFKYMIPLGLVYFFEYLINQGLFEQVYFENIFITHAQQYRFYQVTYQIGVFISRSSINLLQINAIWLLAVFQGLNVILFMLEALFSFVPHIFIVMAVILFEGLLGGAAYVNTFHKINTQVIPEKREFSMSITSLADALGITLAGFIAIPVHNYICSLPKHLFE